MANNQLSQQWRSRILACRQSGLSIQRWCELNGTTYRQFGYWRKRLERMQAPDVQEQQWATLEVLEPAPAPVPSLTVHIAGAEILLSADFDPDLLRSVVSALGGNPC